MARCGCGYNHAGKLVNPCSLHTPPAPKKKNNKKTARKQNKK